MEALKTSIFFLVNLCKTLGGFGNNAYLCTAKIHVRYEDAATIGGYFCICHN